MAQEKNQRREFLKRSAFSVATGALSIGASSSLGACSSLPLSKKLNWSSRRQEFDLDGKTLNFAPFLLASTPRSVRARIAELRLGLDKNPVSFLAEHESTLEARNRLAAARFLGASADDGVRGISLVANTTQALQIVYAGLIAKRSLREKDEILTTASEHFSSREGLTRLARSATAKIIEIDPQASDFLDLFEKRLNPRTRLVAMTWVHSESGVKLPVHEIGARIAAANAKRDESRKILFLVDGVHALGTETLDIREMGCDFFAAGCHKALYGPRGTGLLWTSESGRRSLLPTQPSFIDKAAWREWRARDERRFVATAESLTPGGYHNYESRWALESAFAFHDELGRETIQTHISSLALRLRLGLQSISEIELKTPIESARSSSIVCWQSKKQKNSELLQTLATRGFYGSLSPYRSGYGRFGVGIIHSEQEIDELITALKEICRT